MNLLFDLCQQFNGAVCRKFSIGFQLPLSFSSGFSPAFVWVLVPKSTAEGRGRAGEEGKEFEPDFRVISGNTPPFCLKADGQWWEHLTPVLSS